MSMALNVSTRASRAGAEALRQGRQMAAGPIGAYPAGALLLRGSPSALAWLAGWLSGEFPPQVVTGHALSGVTPTSVGRMATTWAAQRADRILTAALEDCFGPGYQHLVRSRPVISPDVHGAAGCCTPPGIAGVTRRRRRTSPMDPAVVTTCWTSGVVPTCRRAAAPRC